MRLIPSADFKEDNDPHERDDGEPDDRRLPVLHHHQSRERRSQRRAEISTHLKERLREAMLSARSQPGDPRPSHTAGAGEHSSNDHLAVSLEFQAHNGSIRSGQLSESTVCRFINQLVVDYDRSPQEIHFYNLDGNSYSSSVQVQLDLEPVERYEIRLAYRFNDVKSTYGDDLLPVPLSSRNRAFVNMAYETLGKWTFDITWNWQDSKRIPGTQTNPEAYQVAAQSPAFSLVNMQVGKTLMERLNIYMGIENLFGYTQENPIIASEDPFGPYFDSSLIWGPVFGRKFYAGLRFRIP